MTIFWMPPSRGGGGGDDIDHGADYIADFDTGIIFSIVTSVPGVRHVKCGRAAH